MPQPADLADSWDTPGEVPGTTSATGSGAGAATGSGAGAARLPDAGPPRRLIVLLAISCGLTVANLYYAQPLLSELRHSFTITSVVAGSLVTATQLGYALGLFLIVPLGDVTEKRPNSPPCCSP